MINYQGEGGFDYLRGKGGVNGAGGNLGGLSANTTGAPVGYNPLQQVQTGVISGDPMAQMGNAGVFNIAGAPRDMQGTELVPDPRNPGKFIHPNILQNSGYEQRYRDASQNWMKQEGEKKYNEQIQKLRNENQSGGFGRIPY